MIKGIEEPIEGAEEQIINEEYKIWKKNSPFLYDTVIAHVLEWPSLTVDWFSSKDLPANCDYSVHKVVLGTHTSSRESESLLIGSVKLPLSNSVVTGSVYLDNTRDAGGVGLLAKTENKIEILHKIPHEGEVNKARVMPQNEAIIATKSPNSNIYVYDYLNQANRTPHRPEFTLVGHQKEGFGLAWSGLREGLIASGSDDHLVCVWDINSGGELVSPLIQYPNHGNIVEDVTWSCQHSHILASAGDDHSFIIWDIRQQDPAQVINGHTHEINAIDFNKRQPELLATASSDKTAAIWDMRNLELKVTTLENHSDQVDQVRWAPFSATHLATSGHDRRICLWDLAKIGEEQTPEDSEDGPPELIFIHAGHTARISDFSWNMKDDLVIGSVAEDNILQVWQMSYALFAPDELEGVPDDQFMDLDA